MEWLVAGPGALLSGAFIGVVMGILLEDPLKAVARRTNALLRGLAGRRWDPPDLHREFRLGPLHVPVVLIEGDGEHVIAPGHLRVLVNPVDTQLPDELTQWRDEIETDQTRRRTNGEDHVWNGLRYAVEDLVISRVGPAEEPYVTLILKHTDYFSFAATQRLDRRFSDGTTPRSRYLDGREPREVPDFMRSSLGLNMAVVTTDGWLLVAHRSGRVGTGQGLWNSSANEGLSRDKDSAQGRPPDLFEAARRGLKEELRLRPQQYELRLLAFCAVTSLSQWGCLFLAHLRRMKRVDFEAHSTRGIEDVWEHDGFDYVKFEPEPVLRYLLRADRRDNWGPAAPVLFYLSLINAFGHPAVDRAASRVLRELT
jgi:hypothetical protein